VLILINQLSQSVPSEAVTTAVTIIKMVAGIALVNHFLACGWYAIAMEFVDYPGVHGSWYTALGPAEDRSIAYAYTTALHWSLTQFTPASMEVVPKNSYERVFTCIVIIVAMVLFTSLIGTITQSMTQLRKANTKRTQERDDIQRYICDKQVSIQLGNRIRSFLSKRHNDMKIHIHEDDVPSFKAMPEILRVELHSEVFEHVLIPHPFFHRYVQGDDVGIANICHYMMSEKSLHSGKELFLPGEKCASMYFVIGGRGNYYQESSLNEAVQVKAGYFICEMVLWLPWRFVGRLAAAAHCELVLLNAETFRTMLSQMKSHTNCRAYAALYAQELQQAGQQYGLSDIWFSFDACHEMTQKAFEDFAMQPTDQAVTPQGVTAKFAGFSSILPRSSSNAGSLPPTPRLAQPPRAAWHG